ncbi:18101_t:CDS:1, partial [Racocetra persica]
MWKTRILADGKNEVNGFILVKVQKYIDHLQETMLNVTGFCDYVKTKNPFTHMEYLKAYTRVNFFERRVKEYSTIHDIEYND